MAEPTRAQRFRPLELVGLAAVLAVFVGVVVFISTRDLMSAIISLGTAFVVALVGLAMLALATGPVGTETDLRGGSPVAPAAQRPDSARSDSAQPDSSGDGTTGAGQALPDDKA
jgi:hypothetical protein